MTSSPEPAPWALPDLASPVVPSFGRRAPVADDGASASAGGNDAPLAPGGAAPVVGGADAWSLPELTAIRSDSEAAGVAHTPEDEAYALGLADGLREGEARASHHLRPVLEALTRLVEDVEASRLRFERDRERNLRGLALAVAHRLMQREVTADPTWVRDLVSHAIELMPTSAPLEVRLSPLDLAALGPELEKLSSTGRPLPIQWLPEPAIERGSFVVEGPLRIVDGRTDSALRTLFERLEHD